jgi:multiple sugar transport system permease protein
LIGRILLYVSAALIVAWSAAPFLWQFSTSFQFDRDLVGAVPKLWPDPISFDHFINIFVAKSFHRYLINSLIVAGLTTLLCLLIGSIAAYALARLNVRGRFGILGFILAVSMFPQIAVVAPLYM